MPSQLKDLSSISRFIRGILKSPHQIVSTIPSIRFPDHKYSICCTPHPVATLIQQYRRMYSKVKNSTVLFAIDGPTLLLPQLMFCQ